MITAMLSFFRVRPGSLESRDARELIDCIRCLVLTSNAILSGMPQSLGTCLHIRHGR